MVLRFTPAKYRASVCVGLLLPGIVSALLIAHWATVHAQSPEQLSVYSPQTTYSVTLLDIQGKQYAGLIELLEPLGTVEGRIDGKKYKLNFTPPGGRAVEAQFTQGKDKGKVLGENYKLGGNFAEQNGRGYVPLAAAPEILGKMLGKPVQLHASARRLFVGDVSIRYSVSVDRSNPARLTITIPIAVSPSIANEPGRVRLTFRREPVVSNGQDSVTFNNPTITGATFSEHDGVAELDIATTAGLMTNFVDGGKTIVLSEPPPPPPPAAPAPTQTQAPPTPAPTPKAPSGPRFLVILDPAHGGPETGAVITPTLLEKDLVLAMAHRLQRDLASRGIVSTLLRNSDAAITLDQRAMATNAARPALYITLHAANTGTGVHLFTSMLPAADVQRNGFLPWDTAQAAFLDLSGSVAGSVAAELETRKLPNSTLVAPLRPMNNIAAPAIAVEIAPPDDKVEHIAKPEYVEQVAQSIAAGVAAVRSKLPEVRP